MANISLELDVDTAPLDIAIEKANRLVELLEKAAQLIDSLSKGGAGKSEA